MIPKIIHYCWFGRNPLPPLAIKCIDSWKKYLPDYEIKEWNEDNFDVNVIPYTAEAYQAKKYAFVSDYARFWILYKYGGLYFDTDVEVIRPLDDIVNKGPFMGCENEGTSCIKLGVNPGLGLGVYSGLDLYKEILDLYANLHFFEPGGIVKIEKTVVGHVTDVLQKHGLENTNVIQEIAGAMIYPREYFCPIDIDTGRLHITDKTYTIHHYAASWLDKSFFMKFKKYISKYIPESFLKKYSNYKNGRKV